jgi:hypothetical protein
MSGLSESLKPVLAVFSDKMDITWTDDQSSVSQTASKISC